MKSVFKNIRVVELATVLAGPSVGMFLAELGCEVIKIEPPGGDVTRGWKDPSIFPEKNVSPYYASINFGKTVRTKDLKDKKDYEEVMSLISSSDILIENFRDDVQSKFGLSSSDTSIRFPKLIHAHLAGFENDVSRVAYDVIIQAESGFMSINGAPNSQSLKMPVALMDVLAAHQMKEGILAALFARERTGNGGYLTCSLEMSGISALVNQASTYLNTGNTPQKMGSLHPNIAPYGEVFDCVGGEVVLAIGSDQQFSALCELLELSATAMDPRFSSNGLRLQHRVELQQILSKSLATKERSLILQKSRNQKIPIAAIKTIDEVLKQEHVKDFILEDMQDGQALIRLASKVFHYSFSGSKTS